MIDVTNKPWGNVPELLLQRGYAHISNLLSPDSIAELKGYYDQDHLFRSVINMERYRFGRGEYKYFSYELPALVQELRQVFYSRLFVVANEYCELLGIQLRYPDSHGDFIRQCHAAEQRRPTPLILKYGQGGFNTLHQDLYGEVYFPFQVVFALSQHGQDFEGGEFILVEQIPRAQSRAMVFNLNIGDAFIFTTNFRPARGAKGFYRARMKHGISEVTSGTRYALGLIFHDAQ